MPGCCVVHPGVRAMTGTRAPNEAPRHLSYRCPASRRSTVAICASDNALPHAVSPFGLVPALLSLPCGLGRGTFRTGHIDPKDRCPTSRGVANH